MEKKQGIGFFERYLTIWVALCIVIGIAIGQYLPAIPQTLSKFEYANVSIPVAILIWLMIYPMMLKVDFQSIKNVGKRPKGIVITCATMSMDAGQTAAHRPHPVQPFMPKRSSIYCSLS